MPEKTTPAAVEATPSPFHAGELAIQERYGRRSVLAIAGRRAIRDYLVEEHRLFFPQLPFAFVGSVDGTGQPWASVLVGRPGFLQAPDAHHLRINARPGHEDPLAENLNVGALVAILGIELPTRRRNRVNGDVVALDERGFLLEVAQSFGNCPQYIQARDFHSRPQPEPGRPQVIRSQQLAAADEILLKRADTFFIATANTKAGAGRGVDVSHRGGKPGFVRVDDPETLTAPDFTGNFYFNTLGNLTVDPRAGLLFPDFESGDLLLVAASTQIIWDGPEVKAFLGAQRLVRFHVTQTIRLPGAFPLIASTPQYARELARTGTWEQSSLR